MGDEVDDTEHLVNKYFAYGFSQKDILAYLKFLHNKCISARTLKRILSRLKLYRRKNYSRIENVVNFLRQEITKSGQLQGYRWMHLRCIQNNLVVTQDIVRELLWLLDPEGVETRKRKRLRRRQYFNKGPNYLWHLDSYNKSKPFGICINGCIDGFSSHIIWLRAGITSSDPKVIGGYFLDGIKMIGGCPETLRCDMGTENTCIEKIQKSLHELFGTRSSKPCFIYGKSVHNQRIEAWWSILRKHNAQFWMNLFHQLKDDGHFCGTYLDKCLIQFCFMELIQDEMDQIAQEWNVHKIQKSRNSNMPIGRPSIMFDMPLLYKSRSYLIHIPNFASDALTDNCVSSKNTCDDDIYGLCRILIAENRYSLPRNPNAAIQLYKSLRDEIFTLLG